MTCCHHFLIAFPQGPRSKGRCKRCGEEREFLNSVNEYGPERRVAAHTMYSSPGEKLRVTEVYRE